MLTFLLTRAYGKRNLPAGEGVNGLTLKVNRLTHGPKERESNIKRKNIYIYINYNNNKELRLFRVRDC